MRNPTKPTKAKPVDPEVEKLRQKVKDLEKQLSAAKDAEAAVTVDMLNAMVEKATTVVSQNSERLPPQKTVLIRVRRNKDGIAELLATDDPKQVENATTRFASNRYKMN